MATSKIGMERPFKILTKRTEQFGVAANGNTSTSADLAESGWTALGIVGWANGGSSQFFIYQLSASISTQTATVKVRNVSSSAISGADVELRVLYMKN